MATVPLLTCRPTGKSPFVLHTSGLKYPISTEATLRLKTLISATTYERRNLRLKQDSHTIGTSTRNDWTAENTDSYYHSCSYRQDGTH